MVSYPMRISEFTIKAMEDLGFYQAKSGAAQFYTYGQGEGCDFVLKQNCLDNDEEYCSASEYGSDHCYENSLSKGHCGKDSYFMNRCNHVRPVANGLCTLDIPSNGKKFNFEQYGSHSRCVVVSKHNSTTNYDAACITSRCNGDKIEMQIRGKIFTCQKGQDKVAVEFDDYKGSVKCPKFESFCKQFEKRCPLDCMGHGFCMGDGTCQCIEGYSGKDCNTCPTCKKVDNKFITDFNSGNDNKDGDDKDKEGDDKDKDSDDKDKDSDDKDDENKKVAPEKCWSERYLNRRIKFDSRYQTYYERWIKNEEKYEKNYQRWHANMTRHLERWEKRYNSELKRAKELKTKIENKATTSLSRKVQRVLMNKAEADNEMCPNIPLLKHWIKEEHKKILLSKKYIATVEKRITRRIEIENLRSEVFDYRKMIAKLETERNKLWADYLDLPLEYDTIEKEKIAWVNPINIGTIDYAPAP